jgi:predicted nucleic acid-binding protein
MFLADTNVLSEVLRPRPTLPVVRRLFATDRASLFAAEITRHELRFGAALHARSAEIWRKVETDLLPLATWLPVDKRVVLDAADLRASLRRRGTPIDLADALLAATARVHDLVLVTRNARDFANVPDLAIENWFEAA